PVLIPVLSYFHYFTRFIVTFRLHPRVTLFPYTTLFRSYSVLSDPEKRRQYDQFGHAAFGGADGAGGGFGGFGGFDFNSADMGDMFGDIFGDLFGSSRSRGRANNGPMRGANVHAAVRITFEEAVSGCSKELDLNLKETCTKCGGTGAKPGTSPQTCTKC